MASVWIDKDDWTPLPLRRGVRCAEAGCLNYVDEDEKGPKRLCKVCRDEILLDKLHQGKYVGCTDGRASNGNRQAERARQKREAEDAEYVALMRPPQVDLLRSLSTIERWQR